MPVLQLDGLEPSPFRPQFINQLPQCRCVSPTPRRFGSEFQPNFVLQWENALLGVAYCLPDGLYEMEFMREAMFNTVGEASLKQVQEPPSPYSVSLRIQKH